MAIHNLIYVLKPEYKGSGMHAQYLANTYGDIFAACEFNQNAIPSRNRIWLLHNPFFYKWPITQRCNDVSFIRKTFTKLPFHKKFTNGFSYFKSSPKLFTGWFPTIYQSHFEANCNLGIGYYARDCRVQSNHAFADFACRYLKDIPIITMGQVEHIPSKLKQLKNWQHTTNNKIFWKSCSHYFYYRPSDIEDPFPHTLLEAIQSNHRIISPIDDRRRHQDGIDDLLSFISFDTTFEDGICAQHCDELDATAWNNIIRHNIEQFDGLDVTGHSMYECFCKLKDLYG